MAPKPPADEELAAVARWVGHPIRVRIVEVLQDRVASASDITPELGEPLTTVAYHVRLLADSGALELRSTNQVRGAIEHHYTVSPAARKGFARLQRWLGPLTSKPR